MPVNRTGAPALHWETRASRNQNSKHPLRPLAWSRHPTDLSTWPSDSSRSAQHAFRRSTYVSFVSKATLWDRGLCHDTSPLPPVYHPPLCPRFLSHMKSHPKDLRHPCFQSIRSGPQPPSQKTTLNMRILSALKTQTMKGGFHLHPDRRRNVVQKEDLMARRHSAVFVPSFPLTATPAQSIKSPTPPHHNTLHLHSATRESKQNTEPVSLSSSSSLHPSQDESQERGEMAQASVTSITAPGQQLDLGPAGSPISLWQGSLSDLSRPHSSLFSRSTNLISPRSSILSADINDSDPKGSAGTPHPRPQSSSQSLPQTPVPPAGSSPQQFSLNTTTIITSNPPLYKPLFGQTKPLSSHPATPLCPDSDNSLFSGKSTTKMIENHMGDPQLNLSLDSDHGLVTLAFPSATWSSCPSAEKTTPRSGSGAKLTTSPASWLGSHRWPLLPPISPVTERCGTVASCYSELSCTQSHVFEELEAIAPRSTSCPSLDDSSCSMSLETELSPGLAALTVGCDSGNLGSLSRVQLLLLDRAEAETMAMSFRCPEEFSPEEDYADMRMQHDAGFTSEGVVRPLTVGSISERCDSMGRLQKNKSDQSVGGSGSPSPWIIDQSPSYNMFRSSCSPRPSDHSSNTDDEGLTKEEPNYLRWSGRTESSAGGRNPVSLECRIEERERSMEERKMKVLKVLSKLQDITPRHNKSNCGCSNFEAFDFLAKYCIFSQDKLDEYKRAFEAEDSDGDGYISCLQVLLALKSIIPPDLLSDEEEVYVYRILELVDFRVTDGLVDLRLFAVVASLAQKIATMDEFMRSLISSMDFRSLEVRLFKAKEQRGDAGAQQGFISAEQLLLELKAGGICLEQEAAIRVELQHIPSLDLLDFLAYLPLFMLIHKSVISNPLDNSGTSVTAQTDL